MKLKIFQNYAIFDATCDMVTSIDNRDSEIEHIVVVPDKFSLQCEKMILEKIKDSLFNVNVLGISQVADRAFEMLGKSVKVLPSSELLLLTMKAIENVRDKFLTFQKSGINFCYEICKIISQLKSSLISPEELDRQGDDLSGKKYHDLKLIYQEYQRLLNENFDENARLKFLIELLNESDIFKNTYFYFGMFDSFTQEGYSLISALVKASKGVSVAIAMPISIANDYIYEQDIFNKLQKIALDYELPAEVITNCSDKESVKYYMASNLFGQGEKSKIKSDFYYNFSSSSMSDQVNACAKLIYNFVHAGMKYSDIKIALSNESDFSLNLEETFARYDIPIYISSSLLAIELPLIDLVIKFLQVIYFNYAKDSLLALFNHSLTSASELVDLVQVYNVSNKRKFIKYIKEKFEFSFIFDELENCQSAGDYQGVIEKICENFMQKHEKMLEKLENLSYLKEKQINEQAYDILTEAVKLISKYNDEIELDEYYKQLSLILSFKNVESVPAFVDSVIAVQAEENYAGSCKVLFVLGGENLPSVQSDSGLLNDDDIFSFIHKKKIEPTIRMINRRNRFKLFNLLLSPTEKLITFYNASTDEGKKNEVPAFIQSLSDIFDAENISSNIFNLQNLISRDLIEKERDVFLLSLGNKKNIINEYHKILSDDLKTKIDCEFLEFKADKSFIHDGEKVFFDRGYISPSQLETFFNCPFKHFARYGLRINEKSTSEFSYADAGTIIHKYCEDYVRETMTGKESKIELFVEKNFERIIKECDLKEKIESEDAKRSLINFLKRQAYLVLKDVKDELDLSLFKPYKLEYNVKAKLCDNVDLVGKIDRIDKSDDYFRIIDYKSGKVASPLRELYFGTKLQLFLYSALVQEKLKARLAGAIYFNARSEYFSPRDEKKLFKGLISNDESVIERFDRKLHAFGESKKLGISQGKKGYSGSLIAKDDLEKYQQYSLKLSKKGVNLAKKGYILPNPIDNTCDNCPYKALCLNDSKSFRKSQIVNSFKDVKLGEDDEAN